MYCNRNNQLKQRKERQIKNEQSSNINKLILIILITTKFCHVFQITLSKILNKWDLSTMEESFPITSCACSYALNIGWTCPRRLSHRKHVYLFIFCFHAQKFGLCLFNQVTTKMLSNEQIISTQNTYTSFTNVASGCAKRLPSDRPTELNKTQTNGFYLRDESNLTNALFFSIVHFAQLAWPIKGKTRTSRESMTCWGQRSQTLDTG